MKKSQRNEEELSDARKAHRRHIKEKRLNAALKRRNIQELEDIDEEW